MSSGFIRCVVIGLVLAVPAVLSGCSSSDSPPADQASFFSWLQDKGWQCDVVPTATDGAESCQREARSAPIYFSADGSKITIRINEMLIHLGGLTTDSAYADLADLFGWSDDMVSSMKSTTLDSGPAAEGQVGWAVRSFPDGGEPSSGGLNATFITITPLGS